MTPTYTVTKTTKYALTEEHSRPITIRLPAPPFDVPASDRSETAPRVPAARVDVLTVEHKRWLRGAARFA